MPLLVVPSHNPFPSLVPFSSEQLRTILRIPPPLAHQVSASLGASSPTEAKNALLIYCEILVASYRTEFLHIRDIICIFHSKDQNRGLRTESVTDE